MTSSWVIHGPFSGFPFRVALWMYLLSSETFFAIILNILPPDTFILASENTGLPIV